MKNSLFLLWIFVMLMGCSEYGDHLTMFCTETGCSNAWDLFYDHNQNVENAVSQYLESEGIKTFRVYTKRYSWGPFCEACTCPTGRYIYIKIDPADQQKAEMLGFIADLPD